MSPVTPPQVKDKGKRTKIFDWSVPISVGTQTGSIDGELFWVPESSKTPTAAIVALVALTAVAIAFVLFVRRRRRGRPAAPTAGESDTEGGSSREAW
jgi:hypothetical protein